MPQAPCMDWNAAVAIVTLAGLLTTIFVFFFEMRRNRATRHVDLILNFNVAFHDPLMQTRRQRAAKFLSESSSLPVSDPRWMAVDDLIDFFQQLGTIVLYAEIDHALVFKYFYVWQSCYWRLCRDYIEDVRRMSRITWQDADTLHTLLATYDADHNGGALSEPTPAELTGFLRKEALAS